MSQMRPFCPKNQGTIAIANAIAATAPLQFSDRDGEVALFNSSASAVAFVRIDVVPANTDTGGSATIPAAGGASGGFPVPPLAQIRVSPGVGFKWISVIASAADGNLYVTPGHGN